MVVETENDEQLLICKGAVEEVLRSARGPRVTARSSRLDAAVGGKRRSLREVERGGNAHAGRGLQEIRRALNSHTRSRMKARWSWPVFSPSSTHRRRRPRQAITAPAGYGVRVKVLTGDNASFRARSAAKSGWRSKGRRVDMWNACRRELDEVMNGRPSLPSCRRRRKRASSRRSSANGHTVGFLATGSMTRRRCAPPT